MTRKSWATGEQREWLEARKTSFIEAKQNDILKDFFTEVFKTFREKWPIPAPTSDEVGKAGNVELATKIKRDNYNKRVREWFHNNTRTVAKAGPRGGILDIKPRPKMLQAWQAYQALTYDELKPHVDKLWETYCVEWKSEHADLPKPPKCRLQIMQEFMKEKYEASDQEMKDRCDEYRRNLKDNPVVAGPNAERNSKFQTAIDKLPRTVATIGQSLSDKTGWNITIMAGGPSPENGGMIMTYISHTGKTNDGDTLDKFLGTKGYDGYLRDFERFLKASFSQEECNSRSTGEYARQSSEETLEHDSDDGNTGPKINADSHQMDSAGDKVDDAGDKDDDVANKNDEKDENAASSGGPLKTSEYEQRKAENIAELKKLVEQVKDQFPVPEDGDLVPKPSKKPVSRKRKASGPIEPVARRVSERNKEKSSLSTAPTGYILTANEATPSKNIETTDASLAAPAQNASSEDITIATNSAAPAASDGSLPTAKATTSSEPTAPDSPTVSRNTSVISTPMSDVPAASALDSGPPIGTADYCKDVLSLPSSSNHSAVNHSPEPVLSPPPSSMHGPTAILQGVLTEMPLSADDNGMKTQPQPTSHAASAEPTPNSVPAAESVSNEIVTSVANSEIDPVTPNISQHSQHLNDVNNPPGWLAQMLEYLRGITEDAEWQELVVALINFEKCGPPNGNLATKSRPLELTNWIRSKKRTIMPTIKVGPYGKRFEDWWKSLQPTWRKLNGNTLGQDTPVGEKWQSLRKGGTAGIYVIVMGLSWWIKAQIDVHDPAAWNLVNDLIWVIQQMVDGSVSQGGGTKRLREDDDNESSHTTSATKKIRPDIC